MPEPTNHGARFYAAALIAQNSETKQRRIGGVAYSGGLITDHGGPVPVVIDMASMSVDERAPILFEHDPAVTVGFVESSSVGDGFSIDGPLFAGIDAQADVIAAKSDAGARWQMSVRAYPDQIERFEAGQSATVNGRQFSGPVDVYRGVRIREVSVVSMGADTNTHARVFSSTTATERGAEMTQPATAAGTAISADAHAALVAENAAIKAELADFKTKFAAQVAAAREAEIKPLMGDAFSAEAFKPFAEMTEHQFSASVSLMKSMRPKLPAELTTTFAAGGAPQSTESPLLAAARERYSVTK